jgi:sterol desaturase/sphingolipid hydroxylase (fatty acid hydroxylase superfamily)
MVTLPLLLALLITLTILESVVGPKGRRRPRRANLAMAIPVLVAATATDVALVAATRIGDDHNAGLLAWLGLSGTGAVVVGFVLLDLVAYVNHRLRHRVRPFWAFHRTHHTDTDIDVTTSFRHHPFDIVLLNGLLAITVAAGGIGATTVAIAAVTTPIFGLFTHARIRLPAAVERRLARVVQTPGMHRVHHSPNQPQTDSNFGLILSVWDRVFGTFNPPDPAGVAGLDTVDLVDRQSVRAMLVEPWRPLAKPAPELVG